ncbi:GATA transcription factor 27, partial [Mucuna pruriens]
TPLWRNGPSEKPVLCNACGSRYKLKGHLDNYLPKNFQLHSHNNNYFKNIPPTDDIISEFWNKIPTRKRSLERITAMQKFQKELLSLYRCERQPNESSPEEILLVDKVNNFIPSNEIGLGAILLKTDP